MENLIVYEIATKEYTSPNGPQSGTFLSLAEKMPYLQELGINGVWLSGHQFCSDRFGNMWMQYAPLRQDLFDPSLGTPEDFKNLVDTAHEYGIKMFVDVITHGVMSESSLISEHPDWFKGGSWGMVDFDWYGNHPDLDKWWVNIWVDLVVNYDLDGFRIDVAHYRSDLWALIRKQCAAAGHEIMVMLECGPAICGVSDVLQHGEELSDNLHFYKNARILKDAAGHLLDKQFNKKENYTVEIKYKDGTMQKSYTESTDPQRRHLDLIQVRFDRTYTRHIDNDTYEVGYDEELCVLKIENVLQKEIEDIVVYDYEMHVWNMNRANTLLVDYFVEVHGKQPSIEIHFPLRQQKGQYISIQLSCHDNGWEGFKGSNAFAAKGSRHVMGYGCLLAPGVPVFMSGEEFNMDYRPVPNSYFNSTEHPDLREQTWLYANWMEWEQLAIKEKQDMFDDVKEMLHIRNSNKHLMKALRMGIKGNVTKVPYRSCSVLPEPYAYVNEEEAIIIAANPNADTAVDLSFDFSGMLAYGTSYKVTTLFGQYKTESEGDSEALSRIKFRIERDLHHGGGLLVLKLTKRR